MLEIEKGVGDTKEEKNQYNKNGRAVFSKLVKAQYGDIYKVVSSGVTVEYTNRLSAAQSAYKESSKPKQMFKLPVEGGVVCLHNETM